MKQPVQTDIIKRSLLKVFAITLLFSLLVLMLDGCSTTYKHKKFKPVPCPCEKEQKR